MHINLASQRTQDQPLTEANTNFLDCAKVLQRKQDTSQDSEVKSISHSQRTRRKHFFAFARRDTWSVMLQPTVRGGWLVTTLAGITNVV